MSSSDLLPVNMTRLLPMDYVHFVCLEFMKGMIYFWQRDSLQKMSHLERLTSLWSMNG